MSKSKYDFHRNLAVIIGINNYSNGIPELETPVADAEELAKILQKKYQYEVLKLANEKATLQELNSLLQGFKQKTKTLHLPDKTVQIEKNDRLIFYFAGHGIVPADGLENTDNLGGYLVPQDARGDILLQKQIEINKILLPMQDLHDALSELPCRHLLVILDCCFAGAFRSSLYREIVPARKVYKQRYDRFIRYPAWQAIASAAHDQKAIDYLGCFGERGLIKDNKHSPFAEALFEGLRGAADTTPREGDGIITATELYCYVRDRVEVLTDEQNRRQTPGLFPLKKHDKGEYIFLLPNFNQDKLEDAPALNEENNPYRGLKSYEEEHSPLFFGRDELVKQLYTRICQPENPLTVVLGVSGSGKSSLVKAGLIPYLRANHPEEWYIIPTLRPGESPFAALAEAIVGNSETSKNKIDAIKSLSEELKQTPREFLAVIANWGQIPANAKLLLVIDQFEELITICKKQERERFLNFLGEALAAHSQQLCLVLTLRSDFEPRFLDSALKAYWMNARFPVRAMRADELRQAIERPALEKMLDFEPPELVSYLIDEVGQMPGALSLLSFTLSELYIKCIESDRGNRSLTEADYKDLGGVAGSLTHRATEVYNKLDKAQQASMQRVMLRMVTIEVGESARRRVPLSELVYADAEENQQVEEVLKRLDKARLIVGGRETGGEPYVEPAHDALVRGWNKLQEWINEEQENLLLQQRLTPTANDWHINNRPNGLLLPDGDRLNQLEKILKSTNNWLNKRETEFIKSSIKLAEEQRQATLSQHLADQAELILKQQPSFLEIGVLLAVESMRLLPSLQGDQLLRQGLALLPQPVWQTKHKTPVEVVAFSPNGKYIVTGTGVDGLITVWDRSTGREITRIKHQSWIRKIIFNYDGKYLATSSNDDDVKVWEITTGKEVASLKNEDAVTAITFSPQGNYLAIGNRAGIVRVWDIDKNKETFKITQSGRRKGWIENEGWINAVVFSPNGEYLAAATHDARIWNLANSQEVGRMLHKTKIENLAFSPDGKLIATAGSDGIVKLWQSRNAREVTNKIIHDGIVHAVVFSPDGKYLASASEDGTAKISEIDTGREILRINHELPVINIIFSPTGMYLATLERGSNITRVGESATGKEISRMSHARFINAIALSPEGKYLATASDDKLARVWKIGNAQAVLTLKHPGWVQDVVFSPDGKLLATRSFTNVMLWDSITGKKLSTMTHGNGVNEIVFSLDGKYLATASNDDKARIWDVISGKEIVIMPHQNSVHDVTFSPDEKLIATASKDGTARIWERNTGRELFKLVTDNIVNRGFNTVAFNLNSKFLVTAGDDGTARIWDTNTGQELVKIPHPKRVLLAHYSPNGKYLVTISDDDTVWIWNTTTGEAIARDHFDRPITRIAFSPDGRYFAMGSFNNIAKVCETATGKEKMKLMSDSALAVHVFSPDGKYLATRSGSVASIWEIASGKEVSRVIHDSNVQGIAFSPNEKYLATASTDKTVRLWLWQSQDLINETCHRLTRNLTSQEWQRYLPNEPYRRICMNLP